MFLAALSVCFGSLFCVDFVSSKSALMGCSVWVGWVAFVTQAAALNAQIAEVIAAALGE